MIGKVINKKWQLNSIVTVLAAVLLLIPTYAYAGPLEQIKNGLVETKTISIYQQEGYSTYSDWYNDLQKLKNNTDIYLNEYNNLYTLLSTDTRSQISVLLMQLYNANSIEEYNTLSKSIKNILQSAQSEADINSKRQTIVNKAYSMIGVPYVWGAACDTCVDCSGLAVVCYDSIGISLPHYTVSQYYYGQSISKEELQPGDLIFFYSGLSHVGIYIGEDKFIHAPTFGQSVRIDSLSSYGNYNCAARYI